MERAPRQRNHTQIRFHDADERLALESAPEPLREPWIELDRYDPRPGPGNRPGQRSVSGAKVKDEIPGTCSAGPDELVDEPAVSQEVGTSWIRRPPQSPGRLPGHGRP